MRQRRRAVSAAERAEAGARVAARILASVEFARAARVVLYAALADELPTTALADAAKADAKPRLWPRITAAGEIELATAEPEELVPDAAGVLAPPSARAAIPPAEGDLVIVPGVAFSRDGARLGRGGGHYDRLLIRCARCTSIGVAFDFQLVEGVPTQPHDRRVDIVATPSGLWRTGQ